MRRDPESERGPTGDLPISAGEEPSMTSSSKLRESFLSRPASLPVRRGGVDEKIVSK